MKIEFLFCQLLEITPIGGPMKKLLYSLLFLVALGGMAGCGTQDGATTPDTPAVPVTVSVLQVTSSTATINTGGTATISVTLQDSSGQLVAESKVVTFTLDNPALGSIPSPLVVTNGTGSATFTARTVLGSVNITAFVDSVSSSVGLQVSNAVQAASVAVVALPETLSLGGTANISATVLDTAGDPMPNGTTVNFAINNTGVGTLSSSATTTNGVATITFLASSTVPGSGIVTATSGSVSGTAAITVQPAATASIEFNTAIPQTIGIQGAGQTEVSTVSFAVKDINGNLVAGDEQVTISMAGPNGGEYLGDTIPTSFPAPAVTVGTVNGLASVRLHSGTLPGTVTLIATVVSTGQKTASGVVSIGGGKPSAGHFTLATSKWNLPGLAYIDRQATISTLIADRYGNYNVLKGSTVSFDSECGGVDRSVALDAIGSGSVIFRTQNPAPGDTSIAGHDAGAANHFVCTGLSGRILDECLFAQSYYQTFGVDMVTAGGGNPRDGLCTVTAHINGEEEFTDTNANGLYDPDPAPGEPFKDTYDDTFIDMDDDSLYYQDAALPEDLIVDDNLNGSFDGLNGEWDIDKTISQEIKLVITGEPFLVLRDDLGNDCIADPGSCSFFIADGGPPRDFIFTFHDANFNRPSTGSSMSVTATAGQLSGQTSSDFVDSSMLGVEFFRVRISDPSPGDNGVADPPSPPSATEIKFSVTWEGVTKTYSIEGAID
jgi:hypothetical protein